MTEKIISILTSIESAEQAEYITRALLQKRLAACVQQTVGLSTYHWHGNIETSEEYYLHIKTCTTLQAELVAWLEENHPYDTPEIIILEAQASKDYHAWLHSETNKA